MTFPPDRQPFHYWGWSNERRSAFYTLNYLLLF